MFILSTYAKLAHSDFINKEVIELISFKLNIPFAEDFIFWHK